MTDPAEFLSRWSRRKRAAANGEPESKPGLDAAAPDPTRVSGPDTTAPNGDRGAGGEDASVEAGPDQPVFDLSQLPSIETITAETDIRAFLAPGVPAALRQAALRRMWSADTTIRDFIEVAENQWDFNAPGEILGFDFSAPAGDVRRMVADILGEKSASDSQGRAPNEDRRLGEASLPPATGTDRHGKVTEPEADSARGEPLVAMQTEDDATGQSLVAQHNESGDSQSPDDDASADANSSSPRRTHGGATPR